MGVRFFDLKRFTALTHFLITKGRMQTSHENESLFMQRYRRAFGLSRDALSVLCCANGNLRSRLQSIDLEFYSIGENGFPEYGNIRSNFARMHQLVTESTQSYGAEGKISAFLATAHHTKLKKVAQSILDIHHEISMYFQCQTAP